MEKIVGRKRERGRGREGEMERWRSHHYIGDTYIIIKL